MKIITANSAISLPWVCYYLENWNYIVICPQMTFQICTLNFILHVGKCLLRKVRDLVDQTILLKFRSQLMQSGPWIQFQVCSAYLINSTASPFNDNMKKIVFKCTVSCSSCFLFMPGIGSWDTERDSGKSLGNESQGNPRLWLSQDQLPESQNIRLSLGKSLLRTHRSTVINM